LYSTALGYPAQQRRAGEPIEVAVTQVVDESFTDFVAAAGETVGLVEVEIRPQLTGIVERVLVEEGQRVKKGDALLKLSPAPAHDRLSRAKAELKIAELDKDYTPRINDAKRAELEATLVRAKKLLEIAEDRLKRYSSLKDQKAASTEEYAAAEELYATRAWELASTQQQLAQHELSSKQNAEQADHTLTIRASALNEANRDVANTVVNAPSDGLVTRVTAQPGELAVQDLVAMTISADVVFEAFIDQTGINAVQTGDSATVRLVAYPGKQFQGKVVRVNPSVDTQGRVGERGRVDTRFTYSAWIQLDDHELPPGLQGSVEFRKRVNKPAIPDSAVIHLSAGEGMVMVLQDGRAVVKRVDLGEARGVLREVKSGIGSGDQVVLRPSGLEAGDLLQPANSVTDNLSPPADDALSQIQPEEKAL
jgi:HlyD family secretion protein